MKKLSINIKKIALSLLVVGLAIGIQSFTNANKHGALATYYLAPGQTEITSGTYLLQDNPPGICGSGLSYVCSVVSSAIPDANDRIPAASVTFSDKYNP